MMSARARSAGAITANVELALGRQLPPDIEGAEAAIHSFEAWIGAAWLRTSMRHPLRDLWQRLDFVSSIELTILGKSYERLQSTQAQPRLTELATTLKKNDVGNQIGAAYELTTAAMLDVPEQTVRLLGPQQPAYDIELEAHGRTTRFSCKALLPAHVEQEFDRFVSYVAGQVRVCSRLSPLSCLCTLYDEGAGPEHLADRLPITEMHARWIKDQCAFKLGAWWFEFSHLDSEYPLLALSSRHSSYRLLVAAELSGNEERRINAKLEEARGKFRAGGHRSSPTVANAVALRLPPSISLKAAAATLESSWTEDDRDLAGVLATRLQLVGFDNFSTSGPRFQWQWIPNPFADHPLGTNSFRCEWLVGEPMEAAELGYFLKVGDTVQRIERGFVRSLGQVCYEFNNPRSLINQGEVRMRRSPATEIFIILPDGRKLSLNQPPTDSFVFI